MGEKGNLGHSKPHAVTCALTLCDCFMTAFQQMLFISDANNI